MKTIRYEVGEPRLRIEGGCHAGDLSAVHTTLEYRALGRRSSHRRPHCVTGIDQRVVDDVVAAARQARGVGGTVVYVRKHGTFADHALTMPEHAAPQT